MKRGRSFSPLTGDGPLADFAGELRALCHAPLREIGEAANYSASMISEALSGKKAPTPQFVDKYVRACGVTAPEELERWQHKYNAAKLAAAATTFAELAAALQVLIASHGMTTGDIHDRLTRTARDAAQPNEAAWVPTIKELTATLSGHGDSLSRVGVFQVVHAVSGSEATARAWAAQRDNIKASQPTTVAPRRLGAGWRRRWLWAALATTLVVVSATILYVVHLVDRGPVVSVFSAADQLVCSASPSKPPSHTDNTAHAKLLALCTQVLQAPEIPSNSRYTYTHIRVWSGNDTGNADDTETLNDEHSWLTADRAGQRIVIRAVGTGSPEQPNVERYEAGTFPVTIEDLSADPGILATQIDKKFPPVLGAVGRLRTVAEMYTVQWLDRARRVAILQVLADTAGLHYQDRQTDQQGRTGIAFSADLKVEFQTIREVLLFNPETGDLLSHETVSIPDSPRTPGRVQATTAYVLYLEQRQTDSLD